MTGLPQMKTFGNRTAAPAAVATTQAPSSAGKSGLLALLAGLSAIVAVHVWLNILKVPLVRPVGPLFGQAPASQEGWAAWYLPPLAAAILTFLILRLYFRRPHRWTVLAFASAGAFAVLFGAWAAFWVKNIGYTWYFVPGASTAMIVGVQLPMGAFALGRALDIVLIRVPLLLLTGAAVGGFIGAITKFPLLGTWSKAADTPPARPAMVSEPVPMQAPPYSAGWFARLGTTVFMALLGGAVGYGLPFVGLLVMPIAGLVWFFVSFRDGRYSFRNVAIGSVVIAFLSSLPLTLALMDRETLLLSMATRVPFFLLVSVGTIKLVLFLSRKFRRVPTANESSVEAAIPQTK